MKKILKIDGANRGEITVVPQLSLGCSADVYVDPESGEVTFDDYLHGESVNKFKSFQVSARVGESSIIQVHHVPTRHVLTFVGWVEEYARQFCKDFDAGASVEAQLVDNGFTL